MAKRRNREQVNIRPLSDQKDAVRVLSPSNTPLITNMELTVANTEYDIELELDCKQFMVRLRTSADLKLAYVATESATNYISVPAGTNYSEDSLDAIETLYVQSPTAGVILELVEWF